MPSKVNYITAGEYCDKIREAFSQWGWMMLERETGYAQSRQSSWNKVQEKIGMATLMIEDKAHQGHLKVGFMFTFDATGNDDEFCHQLLTRLEEESVKYNDKNSYGDFLEYRLVKNNMKGLIKECAKITFDYKNGTEFDDNNSLNATHNALLNIISLWSYNKHTNINNEDGMLEFDIDPLNGAGYTMDLRIPLSAYYSKDHRDYAKALCNALDHWLDDYHCDEVAIELWRESSENKPLCDCLEEAQDICERIEHMAQDCRKYYDKIKE